MLVVVERAENTQKVEKLTARKTISAHRPLFSRSTMKKGYEDSRQSDQYNEPGPLVFLFADLRRVALSVALSVARVLSLYLI